MIYILVIIALLLLFIYSHYAGKSKVIRYDAGAEDAEERQRRRMEYRLARQAAKDEYRKQAIETYTRMGLADLLPRMIVEESDVDDEFQIRWAGLDKEQEERILKATYESFDTELVGIENEPKSKVNVRVNHADKVSVHGNIKGDVLTDNSTKIIRE